MEEFVKETRALIGKGKLDQAFKAFDKLTEEDLGDFRDQLLNLKRRYNRASTDYRMVLISKKEADLEINQVTFALMDILKRLSDEEDDSEPVSHNKPPASTDQTAKGKQRKILFLASNPTDTGRLRLGAELRDIEEGLRMSEHRDNFELASRFAVRAKDLSRAMLEEEPQIIHFSGHGVLLDVETPAESGTRMLEWEADEEEESLEGLSGGIALEDSEGKAKIVKASALGGLFELFGENIECVLLNACYSDAQANEIIKHVPYVVGMNTAVPDDTAIAFATGFYDALGNGRDIEFAFKLAKNRIELEGMRGADIPVLRKRGS